MAAKDGKLNRINIQTARILEIYSLVTRELDRGADLDLSVAERTRLSAAIETIAGNMSQIQLRFDQSKSASVEESSPVPAPRLPAGEGVQPDLDEIVDAVLKYVAQEKGGLT